MNTQEILEMRQKVILVLKEIFDPEIPVNIWDLGIVYGVDVEEILTTNSDLSLDSNLNHKPELDIIADFENLQNDFPSNLQKNIVSKNPKKAIVTMTLTSPNCPAIESLPAEIKQKIKEQIAEITEVAINLVWEPTWNQNLMTEEARLELGML